MRQLKKFLFLKKHHYYSGSDYSAAAGGIVFRFKSESGRGKIIVPEAKGDVLIWEFSLYGKNNLPWNYSRFTNLTDHDKEMEPEIPDWFKEVVNSANKELFAQDMKYLSVARDEN